MCSPLNFVVELLLNRLEGLITIESSSSGSITFKAVVGLHPTFMQIGGRHLFLKQDVASGVSSLLLLAVTVYRRALLNLF